MLSLDRGDLKALLVDFYLSVTEVKVDAASLEEAEDFVDDFLEDNFDLIAEFESSDDEEEEDDE